MTDGSPPPPPPPLPPPPPSPTAAPRGSADGWATPIRSTSGLRTATVVLFWCTTGAMALAAVASWNRLAVWNGFRDGSRGFPDLDDADMRVALATALQIGLTIAGAIVVSIWSLRSMRNAVARREGSPSPGLACGGWYIPFGMFVVPFVQFRRVIKARFQRATTVNWWQGLFIAVAVCSTSFRSADPGSADTIDDVADRLALQTVAGAVAAFVMAFATIAATWAMRELDRA